MTGWMAWVRVPLPARTSRRGRLALGTWFGTKTKQVRFLSPRLKLWERGGTVYAVGLNPTTVVGSSPTAPTHMSCEMVSGAAPTRC